jgi:hypothetical protein
MSGKEGYFQKLSYSSETLYMASEGKGEMFEGDSEACAPKSLSSFGYGRAEGILCADPRARTPIGVSGNSSYSVLISLYRNYLGCRLLSWVLN